MKDSFITCHQQEEDNTKKLNAEGNRFTLFDDNLGGGVPSSQSYMFDGKQWRELASMSSPRVNHACSLVDMDDGEVCLMNI
jgi:hypothetical protein